MKMELFFGDSSTIIRTCERTNLNPLLLCKQHTTKGEKYCGDSFLDLVSIASPYLR